MIELHRLNGTGFFLNAELIKLIELAPDTLITLAGPGVADGEKIRVRETPREVVELVAQWRRQTCLNGS